MDELSVTAESRIRFERFSLDLRRRTLTAGSARVPLHDRTFDVLAFLIANRDRPVSRQDILAQVFGDHLSNEQNVVTQVGALRKALRQAGCDDEIIQTRGVAYRFIGEIASLPPLASPPEPQVLPSGAARVVHVPTRRSRHVATALSVAGAVGLAALLVWLVFGKARQGGPVVPPRLSIAVMPFDYRGPDQSRAYLGEQVAEDLIGTLAHIPLSTVISLQSTRALKTATAQAVGAALHVRYLLTGTITPEDGRFRIDVRLIDAGSGVVLQTPSFAWSGGLVGDVPRDIVLASATTLHVALDDVQGRLSAQDRPDDADAQDDFFRARARLNAGDKLADLTDAQVYLQQAIAKQPDFADAWAELAWTLLRKATHIDDPAEARDVAAAGAATEKALALSPQNPTALAAQASISQTAGKCDEARSYANQALAIEDSNIRARAVLAQCAMSEGHLAEAAAQYETLARLNPAGAGNGGAARSLGYLQLIGGQYAQAAQWLNRAIDPTEKAVPLDGMDPLEQARLGLIAAHALQGQHDLAAAAYKAYALDWPGRSVWRVRAYFFKNWTSEKGMSRVLESLRGLGMPSVEAEDMAGIADGAPCASGDFAPTPQHLEGGRVLTTRQLQAAMRAPDKPLVLDVGRGAAVIDGAVWWNPISTTDTESDFATREAAKLPPGGARAIVVAGDGPLGCGAYDAALHLIAMGYKSVAWYRGGEESWQAAGGASLDRRLQ